MSASPPVIVRCDGSPEIGLGHVVRCLALADELRDVHGCEVTFAMRDGDLGAARARAAGYPVLEPDGDPFRYKDWLVAAVEGCAARALVLDVRDELTSEDVSAVRERTGASIAVIDDLSDKRLAADDVFYPPIPQLQRIQWPGFNGIVHSGWEWVLLRREFADEPSRPHGDGLVVLVTMGGSDPAGFTLLAIRAIRGVAADAVFRVALGPGFSHDVELGPLFAGAGGAIELVRGPDIRAEMVRADLAVLSFGVTAYEAAACGLPSVQLALTADHAESASAFVDAGIAVSLGEGRSVGESELAGTVDRLLDDRPRLAQMSRRARELVDGRGAARVAAAIVERAGGIGG